MPVMEYEGPVMVRPLYRGVVLCEWPDAWDDLVEQICRQLGDRYSVATGWVGHVRLRIELGEKAPGDESGAFGVTGDEVRRSVVRR